jgi:hypothetical protein
VCQLLLLLLLLPWSDSLIISPEKCMPFLAVRLGAQEFLEWLYCLVKYMTLYNYK